MQYGFPKRRDVLVSACARIGLVVVLCLLFSATAPAQTPTPQPANGTQQTGVQDNGPVLVPEPSEKAWSYYRSGNVLWIFSTLWGWLIPALFLFTGFSARIRTWAQSIGRIRFFTIAIYVAIFTILTFLIDLPLSFYSDYVRQHAYGLSNQTFGKWAKDSLISLVIGVLFSALVLWVPYLLLKRSPRRWWLYSGLFAIPLILFMILIQPLLIDPLFNKFGPMKDKQLEAKILALADRAGIEGGRVFEVEKSEDTNAVNAYVTGFGGTKRIVLWDTTIKKLSEQELLFVMGHEMGHYVLGHIWKTIPILSLLIIVSLYLIHRTAHLLIDRYKDRFGFSELSDIASLPLIILLFGLFLFFILPAGLALNRYHEHEADRFGLELTKNNRAAATAFVKLQTENLGIPRPNPILKLLRASHPPLGERIDFCNEYRPWEKGESLKYGSLFKSE
jgi:STE24 endopeptidase